MFKIFKRKPKASSIDSLFDQVKIEAMFHSHNFLYNKPSQEFYSSLAELYKPALFDQTNPIHFKFFDDFSSNIYQLTGLYSDILETCFGNGTVDNFFKKFEEIINKDYEVKFTSMQIAFYWFHFTENINQEILSKNNADLTGEYERLLNLIKNELKKICLKF